MILQMIIAQSFLLLEPLLLYLKIEQKHYLITIYHNPKRAS
jgi:hypothetical protein